MPLMMSLKGGGDQTVRTATPTPQDPFAFLSAESNSTQAATLTSSDEGDTIPSPFAPSIRNMLLAHQRAVLVAALGEPEPEPTGPAPLTRIVTSEGLVIETFVTDADFRRILDGHTSE